MLEICAPVKLLEELSVEHADYEVEGLVVIRYERKNRTGLFTKFTEPEFIGLRYVRKGRKVELLESCDKRYLYGL